MKIKIKQVKEIEAKFLLVDAGVRYWEDADVDGIRDEKGDLIPCRKEGRWCPKINLDTGIIVNWKPGVRAQVHYKVCDNGNYKITDIEGNTLLETDGYVPDIMCPREEGYGDYIKMDIDETGQIKDWDSDLILI